MPEIRSGDDAPIPYYFSSTGEKSFLRLKFSDIPTDDPDAADFDGDKVSNYAEVHYYGTDPLLFADTDGDGMPDDWETAHSLNLNDPGDAAGHLDEDAFTNLQEYQHDTDPRDADTDHDDISDSDEVNLHQTDPTKWDTDGDGMPDGWEITCGLDPLSDLDASTDPDDDDLSNGLEYSLRTAPDNADTDFDGLTDGDEVLIHSTNPLLADTDDDGLEDGAEVAAGTDAHNPDSDGDGATDGEETSSNHDPNSDQSHPPVWRSHERGLDYHFYRYPDDPEWDYGDLLIYSSDNYETPSQPLTSPLGLTLLMSYLPAFPASPTANSVAGWYGADAWTEDGGPPSLICFHATLNQHRHWLSVKPAATVDIVRTIPILVAHNLNGTAAAPQVRMETVTIPAGQTESAPIDLLPQLTVNPPLDVYYHFESASESRLQVEILARGEKINDGFDPPLQSDKDLDDVRDEDAWVPWTRVGKGGTFETNELTQLVIVSGSVAQMLEVVPAEDSTALIEVPTRFPNSAIYPLTIRGIAGGNAVNEATVEVRLKDSNPAQVVARLKVLVVPDLPTMQLQFYFASDSRYYDYQPPNYPIVPRLGTKIRDDQGGPGSMADEVDLRFNQAGMEMMLGGPTESRDVAFLGLPPAPGQPWLDDALIYDPPNIIPQYFSRATCPGGHLAAILVHRLEGTQGGFYSAETQLCFIAYDKWWIAVAGEPPYPYWGHPGPGALLTPDSLGRDYTRERIFAHEVAHALLPVRNRPGGGEENLPAVNGWAGGHDFGPVPKDTDALMRRAVPKGKWLRHEDWRTVITEAKLRMGIP